jgi:hypothetical protein
MVSPGSTKKVSLRQSSHGLGLRPLRESMYQSVWCMCMMWVKAVTFVICQVSVVPSTGWASERAGLKVLPLIIQAGRRNPRAKVRTQVRSGVSGG